jgi:hypothetical protein
MNIQERFIDVLRKTEQRFDRYRKEREDKERLLAEGKVLDANPSELVQQRLSRLRLRIGNPTASR